MLGDFNHEVCSGGTKKIMEVEEGTVGMADVSKICIVIFFICINELGVCVFRSDTIVLRLRPSMLLRQFNLFTSRR